MADMQKAVSALRAMPSAKTSAKEAAIQRAVALKQRLDMLKEMMVGASPEEAKALAATLKGIARELASLARLLSGSGGSTGTASISVSVAADAGVSPDSGTATGDEVASAVEDAAQVSGSPATPSTSPGTEAEKGKSVGDETGAEKHSPLTVQWKDGNSDQKGVQEKAADNALKKALGEALASLRACIALLKSRHKTADKDLGEAEQLAHEADKSLENAWVPDAAASASPAAGADIGSSVDISV
jgi:hypothetical protein